MIENNNIYFEESNLNTSYYVIYPSTFKIYNVEKKYAWRVRVHTNTKSIGTSEVGFFIIKSTAK